MTSSRSSLFPLPMTAFERFLLADDRDHYPVCPVVTAGLTGRLEEDAFREAVRQALGRHPLFRAVVRKRPLRAPVWVEASQEPAVSFVSEDSPPGTAEDARTEDAASTRPPIDFAPLNLEAEPGLRLHVSAGPDRATMYCQVHHCCADGPGIHRFLGDVLAVYGQLTAYDDPPELMPLDADLLRRRNQWPAPTRAAMRTCGFWKELARSIGQYLTRFPTPLIAADGASGVPTVADHSCLLDREDVRRLRRFVQQRGLTINDVLACELLRCLYDWNDQRGGTDRQLLRLVIPTDLYSGERGGLPAANAIHLAFFGFRMHELRNCPDLAAATNAKTRFLFDTYATTHFDIGLRITAAIPGLLEWLVPRSNRQGTAVLSSLGDPTRYYAARFPRRDGRCIAGTVELERVAVRSLVRPGTFVNISTSLLADQLAISATVDEGHCGPGSACYFATDLRRRVLALLS